jgi:hypothetical protein
VRSRLLGESWIRGRVGMTRIISCYREERRARENRKVAKNAKEESEGKMSYFVREEKWLW